MSRLLSSSLSLPGIHPKALFPELVHERLHMGLEFANIFTCGADVVKVAPSI